MAGSDHPTPSDCRASSVLKLAWPMTASQAALVLMQLADLWMVCRLGPHETQAIGTAALMTLSVSTFGSGFLITVVNALVGHAFGANDRAKTYLLAWQSIWSACVIGFLGLLLFPAAPGFFALIGHPERVQVLEYRYFQVGLFGIIPQLVVLAFGHYFLATGRPKVLMMTLFITVVLNVIFNFLLIFGAYGCPRMGFTGAALGTAIANGVGVFILGGVFIFQRDGLPRRAKSPRFSLTYLRLMFRVGVPAGIQDAVECGAFGILLMFLVNKFGALHLEASSILLRCLQMVSLPADGIGASVMALVAKQIGAASIGKAQEIALIGFRLIAIYMSAMAVLFYVFREPLLQMFTADIRVVEIGSQVMVCIALVQLFDAMTINYIHTLQGAGDSAWPSVVNLVLISVVMLGGGMLVLNHAPFLASFGIWSLAAMLTGAQGLAFLLRWLYGPWKSLVLFKD